MPVLPVVQLSSPCCCARARHAFISNMQWVRNGPVPVIRAFQARTRRPRRLVGIPARFQIRHIPDGVVWKGAFMMEFWRTIPALPCPAVNHGPAGHGCVLPGPVAARNRRRNRNRNGRPGVACGRGRELPSISPSMAAMIRGRVPSAAGRHRQEPLRCLSVRNGLPDNVPAVPATCLWFPARTAPQIAGKAG